MAVHEQRELKVVRLRGAGMRDKDKLSVGVRGVLFFGSFFCTSKRNEQKNQETNKKIENSKGQTSQLRPSEKFVTLFLKKIISINQLH